MSKMSKITDDWRRYRFAGVAGLAFLSFGAGRTSGTVNAGQTLRSWRALHGHLQKEDDFKFKNQRRKRKHKNESDHVLRQHLTELFRLRIGSFLVALETQLHQRFSIFQNKKVPRDKNENFSSSYRNHKDVSGRTLDSRASAKAVASGLTFLSSSAGRPWRSVVSARSRRSGEVVTASGRSRAPDGQSVSGTFVLLRREKTSTTASS